MSTAGEARELGRYELSTGPRVLVGQRINGRVAIIDVPGSDEGRVYLVERHVESSGAMRALVDAYIYESSRRGEPAAIVPDDFGA